MVWGTSLSRVIALDYSLWLAPVGLLILVFRNLCSGGGILLQ